MQSEVVGRGIPFAEGPVWCTDGTLVATSVAAGALFRVQPDTATVEKIATTTGGANGAALAADGSILVTQNGGIDFSTLPGVFASFPPRVPAVPGLQLVTPDGAVTYLVQDGFRGPNDLAITPDGAVYFTDPGHYPPSDDLLGRVMIYGRDGSVNEMAADFYYCNGIAFEPDGTVVVIERRGLQRVFADGTREWVIKKLGPGGGDGFCLDVDGRFYVASTVEQGIRVVDPDGTVVDFLPIEGEGLTTNCCFGGDDLRTLFVTDALPGDLIAFEAMPTPGLPLPTWPGAE